MLFRSPLGLGLVERVQLLELGIEHGGRLREQLRGRLGGAEAQRVRDRGAVERVHEGLADLEVADRVPILVQVDVLNHILLIDLDRQTGRFRIVDLPGVQQRHRRLTGTYRVQTCPGVGNEVMLRGFRTALGPAPIFVEALVHRADAGFVALDAIGPGADRLQRAAERVVHERCGADHHPWLTRQQIGHLAVRGLQFQPDLQIADGIDREPEALLRGRSEDKEKLIASDWSPLVDIVEDDKEYLFKHVKINVPSWDEQTGEDWSIACIGKLNIDRRTSTAIILDVEHDAK